MQYVRGYGSLLAGMRSWLLALGLVCCLSSAAPAQSADEAALRGLAEKFFAAYRAGDLDGLMQLWSRKSPDLAADRQRLQQSLVAVTGSDRGGLSVNKISVEGDRASLRVAVEISAAAAGAAKPGAGPSRLNRTLHLVKEEGQWKVWHYAVSEEELAVALAAANTEEERQARLAAEPELFTAELQEALLAKGFSLTNQGDLARAMSIYQIALRLAGQFGDKKGSSTALRGMGSCQYYQTRYPQALEFYYQSLKFAEEAEDKPSISRVLNNIGLVLQAQGNYAPALETYQRSLRLKEELGDKQSIPGTLYNMGNLYHSLGDYTQALEHHERGLKLARETGDKQAIARLLNGIGNTHNSQGNYTQALEYYQQSLKLAEERGHKRGIFDVLGNMGLVYYAQGNYAQALACYQKCLNIRQELGDKVTDASMLNGIGLVHQAQGNYAQALAYYQQWLTQATQIGDKPSVSDALRSLGDVYRLQGDYAQALAYYQQCLKLAEEGKYKQSIAYALNDMGAVHYAQGNYAKALEYHRQSLKLAEEMRDKPRLCRILDHMGLIHYARGDYAQTLELAQRAAAIASQISSAEDLWQARITAGRAYRALGQPEQARAAFADAIDTIEKLRTQVVGGEQQQQRFFENRVSPYYEMVDLLIAQHDPAEALVFAERAKGRVLLDVLSSGRINITKAMTAAEQTQERALNGDLVSLNSQVYRERARQQLDATRLADLETRLQKARLSYEAFQTSLYAAHPELKSQRGEAPPLTLADSAALIPDAHTALLEFVATDDRTYLFVLSKPTAATAAVDLRVYPLNVSPKDLADRARRFRQRLAGRDVGIAGLATSLYDLLLGPARAQLRTMTSLVIVPDGALWELPFQALMPAPTRYLIEDAAISYAPSLTVLREMIRLRRRRAPASASAPTLLAFGNPVIGKQTRSHVESVLMDERLLPLPEAGRQVRLLGQLYGPSHSRIYLGAEAREDRAKAEAGNCRILHLATHGILNNASPMYSQVVLSQSDADLNNDGLLEAWEIMQLNLNADLVILSACDTARGRVGAGEGLIGLSWALFVAGSPTTVVSQWKVESRSTTELMTKFHRQLKLRIGNGAARVTKAEALRQAALQLRRGKAYSHPFYWAAFVVVGEGQ